MWRTRLARTGLDRFEVRLVEVGLCHTAVALEGADSRHQHAGAGSDAQHSGT